MSDARVLDPCSGSRMMWFDRGHPDVVFGDKRRETVTVTDRSHGRADGTRTLTVDPDMLMDFRALPFNDGTFRLVAFDPPHLVRAGPRSWLAAKYGKLGQDWRDDLRQGFAECFRVLHPHGVLVFKWNETQVKLSEVLALVPHAPLFGNTSGKKAKTPDGKVTLDTLEVNEQVELPRDVFINGEKTKRSELKAGDVLLGGSVFTRK